MGKHDRCVVGSCDNDKRFPEKYVIHSNVKEKLVMHKFPSDPEKRTAWTNQILKGRKDFMPGKYSYVCSIHFIDGKPTQENPVPTLFLTATMNCAETPKKKSREPPRKRIRVEAIPDSTGMESGLKQVELFMPDFTRLESESKQKDQATNTNFTNDVPIPLTLLQISRESDVIFYTGLQGTKMFKVIFDFVKRKASVMTYWDGSKKTLRLRKGPTDIETLLSSPEYDILPLKPGPPRKLTLEQEFLMVMMRLRLGLLIEDLAFRFCVSAGKVSQTVVTWIKLLSRELSVLIMWPSRQKIRATLPDCFKRLYPKVRTIIDCTEVFVETPSSLEVQAYLWSDYKHHCTVKFLVAITPCGATSWISPLYGGRTSDIYIVRDSGFLNILEPLDQVMADRGFKMKTDLALKQCTLCIPPSAAKGAQMTASDVKQTSNIANVRIYVEQAIKRIKEFRILKVQQPLLYLPLMNDIVTICGALANLRKPLVGNKTNK